MCNIFAEAETGWSQYPESRKMMTGKFFLQDVLKLQIFSKRIYVYSISV